MFKKLIKSIINLRKEVRLNTRQNKVIYNNIQQDLLEFKNNNKEEFYNISNTIDGNLYACSTTDVRLENKIKELEEKINLLDIKESLQDIKKLIKEK